METKQKRILDAKKETILLIEKWKKRKVFDVFQENEKQQRIAEYTAHLKKLDEMFLEFIK